VVMAVVAQPVLVGGGSEAVGMANPSDTGAGDAVPVSWRAGSFLNVPLGIVMLVAARRVPRDPAPQRSVRPVRRAVRHPSSQRRLRDSTSGSPTTSSADMQTFVYGQAGALVDDRQPGSR
jgi:hypothetical protein